MWSDQQSWPLLPSDEQTFLNPVKEELSTNQELAVYCQIGLKSPGRAKSCPSMVNQARAEFGSLARCAARWFD